MRVMPGAGFPPGGAGGMAPPSGPSPAMMPQQAGLEANAMVKVNIAVKSLIDALGQIKDVGSDMGKGIVDALRVLSKVVPEVSESLAQSEVASMMGGASAIKPQMGGGQQQPPTMLGTARPVPMQMR